VDPNATTYSVVERVIAAPGGQLLSQSSMIVLKSKGPGSDLISISFAQLEKAVGNCKNLAVFTAKVRPVMTASCVSCHGNQATFKMAAADSDDIVCGRALQRVDFTTPAQSPIIQLPRFRAGRRDGSAHPATTLTDANVTSFLDWISGEAR
jgi:hypothetical protein